MNRLLCALILAAFGFLCSCHRQAARQTTSPVPSTPALGAGNIYLTDPGSKPFHLKAVVAEATNLQNNSYKAEIEEYWVAPDKWHRIIKSEGFSSDYIADGSEQSELISGDYYPNWLRTIVTAIFDPRVPLQSMDVNAPSDNPMPGSALSCKRYSTRVGIAPVQNNVFSTVCFEGDKLESVQIPGYSAEYRDYKAFNGAQVPRIVREYIEPGTEVEAKIVELTELSGHQESWFQVKTPASSPVHIVTLDEAKLRQLASNRLELNWPPTRGAKTEGTLSIYVCLDRTGRVRETYALNSDNAGMSEAAQQQLRNIQFSPVTGAQGAAQAEGILTFAFRSVIQNP